MFVEPLGPWRTAVDGARPVQALADHPRYRQAERLILVCDNYLHFDQTADRTDTRTPVHGSGLAV